MGYMGILLEHRKGNIYAGLIFPHPLETTSKQCTPSYCFNLTPSRQERSRLHWESWLQSLAWKDRACAVTHARKRRSRGQRYDTQ